MKTLSTKKFSDITNELSKLFKDPLSDPQFKDFLIRLGGGEIPDDLDNTSFIRGWCEDLAIFAHYKYNNKGAELNFVDSIEIRGGHYFIFYKGKYYDSLNPLGKDSINDFVGKDLWSKSNGKDLTPYIKSFDNYDGGHSDYNKYLKLIL